MRLLHLSDNHGSFETLPLRGVDAVVHSGDFMPNKPGDHLHIDLQVEPKYQRNWLQRYKDVLKEWMPPPMPFLFCRGNYDFMDPVPTLRSFGLNAIDVTNKFVLVGGVSFYGFPYIPWIDGEWCGELETWQMQKELETLVQILDDKKPDVLVCHGPMHNVMDLAYGQHLGSKDLGQAVFSVAKHFPKAFLCGHIHESHGQSTMERESGEKMHLSNAATTFHIFEV